MTGETARVVHLAAPRQLEIRTETLQPVGPNDLLCETIVTAISPGTEIAAYTGLPPLRPGTGYPRLQGYCNVARVTAVGGGVAGINPGDRVLSFISHRDRFILPSADVLLKLPLDADADRVATAYLFHLGYNAVLRSGIRAGSRVLVMGLGVLGLTSVAMAAAAGAEVHAVSDQATASGIAVRFGAAATTSRAEFDEFRASFDREFYDVVITTVSGWSDWRLALRSAGPLATIAVLGFPGRGEGLPPNNPLDSQYFYTKQLRVEAMGLSPEAPDSRGFLRFNERANLRYIVDLIRAGKLDPGPLVSGTFPGEKIEDAYRALIAREASPFTFLLHWRHD